MQKTHPRIKEHSDRREYYKRNKIEEIVPLDIQYGVRNGRRNNRSDLDKVFQEPDYFKGKLNDDIPLLGDQRNKFMLDNVRCVDNSDMQPNISDPIRLNRKYTNVPDRQQYQNVNSRKDFKDRSTMGSNKQTRDDLSEKMLNMNMMSDLNSNNNTYENVPRNSDSNSNSNWNPHMEFSHGEGDITSYGMKPYESYSQMSTMDNDNRMSMRELNTSTYQAMPYMGHGRGTCVPTSKEEIQLGMPTRTSKSYGYANPFEHYYTYIDQDIQQPDNVVMNFPRGGMATRIYNKSINQTVNRDIM